jgi:hypothetical protein
MDVTVTQPTGSSTHYEFTTSGTATGGNLGIQLDPGPLVLKLEGAAARLKAGSLSSTERSLAAFFGLQW